MNKINTLLEYREEHDSWYFTGDLDAAKRYLRGWYGERLFEIERPTGAFTVGEGDSPEDLHSWGTSTTGDHEEAWRYFAGVDFGPVDEEYNDEALRSLLEDN